ncbi:YgaP-like transmembrane domain [Hansschlegelia sp. KR7-227]|uniref:YgaP-like transmembrane domain n=1 Tax=Hansschlegelia sp. KR7-227 TaxID=3400914 RepID=UPI003C019920
MSEFRKGNVGGVDRALRALVAVALAAFAYVQLAGPYAYAAYAVAAVLAATALIGSCPMYTLLGVSTCRSKIGRPT